MINIETPAEIRATLEMHGLQCCPDVLDDKSFVYRVAELFRSENGLPSRSAVRRELLPDPLDLFEIAASDGLYSVGRQASPIARPPRISGRRKSGTIQPHGLRLLVTRLMAGLTNADCQDPLCVESEADVSKRMRRKNPIGIQEDELEALGDALKVAPRWLCSGGAAIAPSWLAPWIEAMRQMHSVLEQSPLLRRRHYIKPLEFPLYANTLNSGIFGSKTVIKDFINRDLELVISRLGKSGIDKEFGYLPYFHLAYDAAKKVGWGRWHSPGTFRFYTDE